MYNPVDDNELDRLSREAAEHVELDGTASWSRMAQELDKVLPQDSKKRRLVLLWWLLPCLLATGLSFYFWRQYHERPLAATKPAAPLPVRQNNIPIPGLPESTIAKTHPPATDEQDAYAFTQPKQTFIDKKNTLYPHSADARTASSPLLEASVLPRPAYDAIRSQQPVTKEATGDNTTVQNGIERPLAANSGTDTHTDTHHTDTSIGKKDNHPIDTSFITDRKPSLPLYSKFSMGLVAGTDFSNVKFRYTNAPGYNIGLMAGYHLNNHWSLHTGAVYTKKNYKMDGVDFTAPKGSPASYWDLKTVEGDCSMWDIPLLVRFRPGRKSISRFSFSTGLSSYFMKNENYDYYYPSPVTGRIVQRSGHYDQGDTHWLSVVHLSAGFEKPVGRKISMQFEPYVKLPLAGLGVGSMRLNSLGFNVTVQYRGTKGGRISTSSTSLLVSR